MPATVADAIVERLSTWGVDRIFGYAGDGIDPLLAALHRAQDRVEFVQPRHEEMAAFMATGHAKYSRPAGRVPVHPGSRRDPPADRPLRRQARRPTGGGDHRPDRLHRDGQRLPAGGRPAVAVQGRLRPVRADGGHPRAGADADRQRHAHRAGREHPGLPDRAARRTAGGDAGGAPAQSRGGAVRRHRRSSPGAAERDPICTVRWLCCRPVGRSRCWSVAAPPAPPPRSRSWSTCSVPA